MSCAGSIRRSICARCLLLLRHSENSAISADSGSEYLKAHAMRGRPQDIPGFMPCPLSALRAHSRPDEESQAKRNKDFSSDT